MKTGTIYALNRTTDNHTMLLEKYSGLTAVVQQDYAIHHDDTTQLSHEKLDEFLRNTPASKILILHNDADELHAKSLESLPVEKYSIILGSPHAFFVEYLPMGMTKGEGLKLLCESLSISMNSVVAFGDGDNDVEFLSMAGHGVAVQNARDVTKAAADIVLEVQ